MEDAFWSFVDQKWKDSLCVVAVEPAGWEQGADQEQGELVKGGQTRDKNGWVFAPQVKKRVLQVSKKGDKKGQRVGLD